LTNESESRSLSLIPVLKKQTGKEHWYVNPEVSGSSLGPLKFSVAIFQIVKKAKLQLAYMIKTDTAFVSSIHHWRLEINPDAVVRKSCPCHSWTGNF